MLLADSGEWTARQTPSSIFQCWSVYWSLNDEFMLISMCVCVCWPGGFRSPTLLTSRVFCQVSQPHRDPVNSKKNTMCFRNSLQYRFGLASSFLKKKCLRLMGFPQKYVKLSPFHASNRLQIIQITTSFQNFHPPSAMQTLGGVWPLLPLA